MTISSKSGTAIIGVKMYNAPIMAKMTGKKTMEDFKMPSFESVRFFNTL
jgi:hypothetical protein